MHFFGVILAARLTKMVALLSDKSNRIDGVYKA